MASVLAQAAEDASALRAHSHARSCCALSSAEAAAAAVAAAGAEADRDALVALLRQLTMVQVGL